MQEALDLGVLQITELSQGGSVPQLMAVNKGKSRILIVDGEQLIGAKQDRVVNTTILLAPESKTVIPVSCTEHGRWNYSSREFQSTDYAMSSDIRKKKMRSVSESLKHKSTFESNQGEIWDEVANLNKKAGAQSSTGSMKDGFDAKKKDVEELINAFSIQPHQRGVLVFINGIVVGFEMISREDAFQKLYSKLLRSYAMDAILLTQRPSHRSTISTVANAFIAGIRNCNAESYPSVGLGVDYRFSGNGKIGSGLVVENIPVYLAFYTTEEEPTRPHNEGQMAEFRNRRAHAMRRNP